METTQIDKVSVEMLQRYDRLHGKHLDALVAIIENGKVTALRDDAFRMYDIVHTGTPVIFVQNPLSENPENKVATFTIPESDLKGYLPKIMRRYTSFIVSRLTKEDE